jgi:hypothetical protein
MHVSHTNLQISFPTSRARDEFSRNRPRNRPCIKTPNREQLKPVWQKYPYVTQDGSDYKSILCKLFPNIYHGFFDEYLDLIFRKNKVAAPSSDLIISRSQDGRGR